MKNRERAVIYVILALLVITQGTMLLEHGGVRALADPVPGLDTLGPADTLTLLDADGGDDLVLRSRGQRLAWGPSAHDRAYSTSFVYIGKILNGLMQSGEFGEERTRLIEELSETENDYRERIGGLMEEGQGVDSESEEFKAIYDQYVALRKEYATWQEQAILRRGKLDATQLEEAYRQMVEAVEVVADRRKIDTVYRFIPTGEEFNTENPEQAMLAIRMRTALRYPAQLDITDDVLRELALDIDE